MNGGYPVVGGRTFGPTGDRLEEDRRVIDFMKNHVTLVRERDRAMFSPAITVKVKDGTTYSGEYPYARMAWTYDQLVERLRGCVPGYPLGQAGFDALVQTLRGAETLATVEPILEVTRVT